MMRQGRPRLVVYNPDPEPAASSPPVWDRVPPPPPLDIQSHPTHSNPPLSSPSSTSSRAIESTPPPSTPGLSNQIVDLGSDSPSSPDAQPAPHPIEHVRHQAPKKSFKNMFGLANHHHQSSSNVTKERTTKPTRRPQTSPTVSTSSEHHQHVHYPPAGTGERTLIAVTTDWDRFMPVDITGATGAEFIKERILSKLQVNDDDQSVSTFTFHKTDFSGQSTSDALTNDQLFQLCREEGDATGRLNLFVRVAHTRAADPHKLFHALSPSSNTLVPPPFPMPYTRPPPMQPSSRQDSISSASESHPEANGYEGDVDGEQPITTRRGLRPLPQPTQPPASPREAVRPLPSSSPKVSSRPLSPPVVPVQESSRYAPSSDPKYGQSGFTVGVPPLSPSRSTFPQNEEQSTHLNLPQIRHLHIRSGSDAAAEREAVQQQQSTESSGSMWNTPHPPLRTPGMHKTRPRRGISENDEVRPDLRYSDKDRQGSQDVTRSPQFVHRTNHISNSPVRPKNSSPSVRGLSIPIHPTNPPPAVPGASHEARQPARASNQQVPSNWPVLWKGGDNKTKNAPVTPTSRSDRHILNRYKSEDSLRALARGNASSHPVNLQPGGRKLPLSGNPNSSDALRGGVNGLPRSYEVRKQLPMHGPVYGDHRQQSTTSLLSPSTNDPYVRPNSSLGENGTIIPGPSQRVMTNIRSPTNMYNSSTFSPITIDTHGDRPSMSRSPGGSPHSPPRPTVDIKSDSSGSSTYTPVSGLFSELSRWTSDEGSSTIIAPKSVAQLQSHDFIGSNLSSPTGTFMSTESDDLWKVRPQDGTIIATTSKPKLEVNTSSQNTPIESKQPSYMSSRLSPHGSGSSPRNSKALMQGTFAENSWAPRPPAEVVYDRLEEFFADHDLDRPVVESTSGGTSPTNPEPAVPAPLPERDLVRARGKKSIRVVAKEHQRRVRDSTADTSAIAMHRKRSTKLWGSKVEEITPAQAKAALSVPESPSSTGASTFKWVRGELIGKGTYGRVYLALNATTGEMIAVKQVELVSPHGGANDSRQDAVVSALKMESETLKDLDHPNIVSYLGFEETPQTLSIFLEYVPGGSISSCLHKHGKFDEEVTKSFMAQILSGLEYLHSKRIIHRDLKADNILVETSGVCKISDFGISKRTTDLQASTSLQGTVFWMAPEVVDTRLGPYNSKVDIWSVGCVVLEMWGGTRPWNGEASWAVMFKLYNERQPPPVPEDVTLSPLAEDFRQKCFAINPDERPTATELKQHPYLTLAPGWIFTGFRL